MENWNISNDGPFKNMSITDRPSIVKKNLQFLLIYDGKERYITLILLFEKFRIDILFRLRFIRLLNHV